MPCGSSGQASLKCLVRAFDIAGPVTSMKANPLPVVNLHALLAVKLQSGFSV